MSKLLVLMLVLAAGCTGSAFRLAGVKEGSGAGVHWALLVAGSSGWMNYRHQSDVCHAYQILHKHNIPDDRIIVMMYDDIANNDANPHQGAIFNTPGGPNVYTGVPKDYTGDDVTPKNFLAVLQGNKEAVQGIGTGRVIESGPDDNVFVFFSDHGATDLIAFPTSELMESDLQAALQKMRQQNQFSKLVFYLEACESGSMFNSYSVDDVFVVTASGPDESSYACFYNDTLGTYMGDVFSVNWIQDSEKAIFDQETLLKQYKDVKRETNTSQVHKYGDMSFDKDKLGQFQAGQGKAMGAKTAMERAVAPRDVVPSPEVPMAILHRRLMAATDPIQRSQILQEIVTLGQTQQRMVSVLKGTVEMTLGDNGDLKSKVMTRHGVQVTDWDCYKTAVSHFSQRCFPFQRHDYALSLLYILANLCEERVPSERITSALDAQCK